MALDRLKPVLLLIRRTWGGPFHALELGERAVPGRLSRGLLIRMKAAEAEQIELGPRGEGPELVVGGHEVGGLEEERLRLWTARGR
jgi:hypothetical protein